MRRRTAVTTSMAAVLVGVAVAVGVPLAVEQDRAPAAGSFGAGVATRLAEQPAAVVATPATPVRRPAPIGPASPPVRLTIAGLDIAAPVVPVGVDADGSVVVPEEPVDVQRGRARPVPGH